jgi:hypothetical protein
MSDKTKENMLAQPVEYHVDYMDTASNKGFDECPGMVVHIVETETELVGIPPGDDYNLSRYMERPNTRIIGRGILVERSGFYWFVAWRPFSPAPKFNYDLMTR